MRFLADTNIISEVRKGLRRDENVGKWYSQVGQADIFISVIALGEIRKGIEQLRQRGDLPQTEMLERWLTELTGRFGDRILPINPNIAGHLGQNQLHQAGANSGRPDGCDRHSARPDTGDA